MTNDFRPDFRTSVYLSFQENIRAKPLYRRRLRLSPGKRIFFGFEKVYAGNVDGTRVCGLLYTLYTFLLQI